MTKTDATRACLDALRARLGPERVVTAEADIASRLVEARGLYQGSAAAVIFPGDPQEVAFTVAACAEAGVPVVAQGGNTGLVGGGVPHGGIVLSLTRLDRIREVDRLNATITVEAGCILQNGAGGGRGGGLPVSPVPGVRGHLPHRRQPRHQRGRHGRAALRQHARADPRPRGRAGGRAHLERPHGPAQGQYRLRPARPLHRVRGHARHHHRRSAEALPETRVAGDRLRGLRRAAAGPRAVRSLPRRLRAIP